MPTILNFLHNVLDITLYPTPGFTNSVREFQNGYAEIKEPILVFRQVDCFPAASSSR
jgi:hypothetical protein